MAERKNKKAELMDAAMEIVAEIGFASFSMKKVTDRVNVAEGLIYKHFSTKDNLFFCCFESIHKQIAALFDDGSILQDVSGYSMEEIMLYVKRLWIKYFSFLVKNKHRTLYYFEYRDSPYMAEVMAHDAEAGDTYFKNFVHIFIELDKILHIYDKVSPNYLWTYILDVSGIFAKRIIRGELPDGEESYDAIYNLILNGISVVSK